MNDSLRRIELVVSLWIDEDMSDVEAVISEMDYQFEHPAIRDTRIEDLITEI